MNLDKLLKASLSLQHNDSPEVEKRAQADLDSLSAMLSQPSDADLMIQSASALKNESLPVDQRIIAFENLLHLIEGFDNSALLKKLNIWESILDQLSSDNESMQVLSAQVIGTAVQNHEVVQAEFLETEGLSKLLVLLKNAASLTPNFAHKILFAIGSLLRNNKPAVEEFDKYHLSWVDLFGIAQLYSQKKDEAWIKVCLRSLILIDYLLTEEESESNYQKPKIIMTAIENQSEIVSNLCQMLQNDIVLQHDDLVSSLCSVLLKIVSHNRLMIQPAEILAYRDICKPKITHLFPHLFDLSEALLKAMLFDSLESTIEAFKKGAMVIVLDEESRENEGDLTMAAQFASEKTMAFFVRYTSGMICAPASIEVLEKLKLPVMIEKNEDSRETNYTVTCDAKSGITTGISAADRATTLKKMADPSSTAADFTRPGHMLPLRPKPKGLLERQGHTESAVSLCDLSNLYPVAAIAELVNDDGTMKRLDDCLRFADEFRLKIISVKQLCACYQN